MKFEEKGVVGCVFGQGLRDCEPGDVAGRGSWVEEDKMLAKDMGSFVLVGFYNEELVLGGQGGKLSHTS